MIRATLSITLGLSCLAYGQAGVFGEISFGLQAEGYPSKKYTDAANGIFDTFLLDEDGGIDFDLGFDESCLYRKLVESFSINFNVVESAIDSDGRIHINGLYIPNVAEYKIIDDATYADATILQDFDFGLKSGGAVLIGLTDEGLFKQHVIGEPNCIPIIPDSGGWIAHSAAILSDASSQVGIALAAIDTDGFLHTWSSCSDQSGADFLTPPNFSGFIEVETATFNDSAIGIGLQENGDVYIWGGQYGPGVLLISEMRSISRDPSGGGFSGVRVNGTPDWDLLIDNSESDRENIEVIQIFGGPSGDCSAILPSPANTFQADSASFQETLNNCSDFDVINISAGEYDLGEYFPDDFDNKSIVINGVGSSSVIRLPDSTYFSKIDIRNCTVNIETGSSSNAFEAARFENCKILSGSATLSLGGPIIEFQNCDFSDVDLSLGIEGGFVISLHIENSTIVGLDLSLNDFYCNDLAIVNCEFKNNVSSSPLAGALTLPNNNLWVVDLSGSTFANNQGIRGAGICIVPSNNSPQPLLIRNGTFENNSSVFGGAIYSSTEGSFTVTGSRFIANSSANGASIYVSGEFGSPNTVSECSFVASDDSSSEIVSISSDTYISECLFSGTPLGGYDKIWNSSKSVFLAANNTFCENIQSFSTLNVFDLGGNLFEQSCDQVDCNGNGQIDSEEIDSGLELDCDVNGILDSCELSGDPSLDCDGSGTLDSCDFDNGTLDDCNQNQIGDACEITADPGLDSNADGIIDSCQCITDINLDGVTDFTDIVQLLSCWQGEVDGVCAFADVDKDDVIGFGDLLLVLSGFGPC